MEVENENNEESQKEGDPEHHQQQERRNSIREILADDSLTQMEKRKQIQSLMDGRRRSSGGASSSGGGSVSEMAQAAADAAEYYQQQSESFSATQEISLDYGNDGHEHHLQENGEISTSKAGSAADDQHSSFHTRRKRSSSMPLWSDQTSQAIAPLAAARSANKIYNDPININRRMEKSRPPCVHYERNCTIISPCCGLAFGCRICHDECPVLPLPFSKRQEQQQQPSPQDQPWQESMEGSVKRRQEKRPSLPLGFDEEETHHNIDRFAIKEVICRLCYVRQSSKTNFCNTCQVQFGAYHCDVCNLWMSEEEDPYHCAACGFCRVGGRENFRHCDDCGMCIDAMLFEDHNCKAGKYMSNCPVCQEDLFSSRDASHEMPCGHAIHWHCFKELTSYDTRCPVCKKTAETPEHMAATWQAMAMGIALQPVPPELARVVSIVCNDCEEYDHDRRWHFLGVRCQNCLSFNTTVERTSMTGPPAAEYLDELDQLRGTTGEGEEEYAGHGDPMDADG